MRHASRFALALLLAGTGETAEAWSGPGHQAICEIAFLELGQSNPAVQKKVKQIMAGEADAFKPFATACTWADEPEQKDARRIEHYVNTTRTRAAITDEDCGAAPKCLFSAITDDATALEQSSGKEQREALKYLAHWVADLHQPLHVSYADDHGGNRIPVSKENGCIELHGTWDRCIPEALRQQLHATNGPTSLGRKLQAEITADDRAKWRQGTIVDWAEESYAITRAADTQYCLMQGDSCCYDTSSCENTAGDDKTKQTKRFMPLPAGYEDGHIAIVKERLKKAGVRLAAMIEARLH